MGVSHVYPIIDFTLIDYVKIPVGAYLIGFDTSNGGKLCKIDHYGVITVIEGGGGGGGTAGHIIQEEGSPLAQRASLNFIGSGVTAVDDALNNRTNIVFSGGSSFQYFIEPVAPTDPPYTFNPGDRWFNTTTGSEFVWIDDGTSSAWVEIPAAGGNGGNYYISATPPPVSPAVGDRWFNTTAGIELTWVEDGTSSAWVEF